jgi:hypothetical protein
VKPVTLHIKNELFTVIGPLHTVYNEVSISFRAINAFIVTYFVTFLMTAKRVFTPAVGVGQSWSLFLIG